MHTLGADEFELVFVRLKIKFVNEAEPAFVFDADQLFALFADDDEALVGAGGTDDNLAFAAGEGLDVSGG